MVADVVFFVAALAAVVATATLVALSLRLRSAVSFVLAVYVLASAEVVLLTLVLSAPHLVESAGYALGEAVLLAVAGGAWLARGRPRLPLPRIDAIAAARRHPVVALLALAILAAFTYELFIVSATPPNNGDSLTYHLTRAAAWLRHAGLYRIPNAQSPENDYPPNAEIQILYTFAFLHRDTVAALTQWCAQVALVAAVYGCARRLGYARPASLFAALLAPTLSDIALQSMTTQNDLVVAAYVAACAYFLRLRAPIELALAGVAFGLALGTKFTAVFALPALLLIALVSLRGRFLVIAAAAAVGGFVLFGSYVYVNNVVASGRPTGSLVGDPGLNRPVITARGTVSTVARNVYRFIDLSGLDVDYRQLLPITGAGRRLFAILRIPTNPPEATVYPFAFTLNQHANEDLSFFGPIGFAVVLPLAAVYTVLWARRRSDAAHGAHALALPLYLLALALGYRYGGQGRFLITAVALTLPLAATLYRRRFLATVIATGACVFLALALAHDEMKPTGLRGTKPIWTLTRSQAQALDAPVELEVMIDEIASLVPADAILGVVDDEHDPDYVLYGPSLRRRLVWLPHDHPLERAACHGLRWIYVGRSTSVGRRTPGWRSERLDSAGTLLTETLSARCIT